MIIYEAPHRLTKTLEVLAETLGLQRSLTICKELTKKHETFIKTTLGEALDIYKNEEPRGEYVLIIAGKPEEEIQQEKNALWQDITVEEHLQKYLDEGMSKKDAVKQVAADRGLPKRDVYAISIKMGE